MHRRDDLPVFDEAFDVFWRQRKDRISTMDLRSMGEQRRYRRVEAGPPPPGREQDGFGGEVDDSVEQPDRIDLTRTYSAREVLRVKDFAEFTGEETQQARHLMATLQVGPWNAAHTAQGAGQGSRGWTCPRDAKGEHPIRR